MKERYANLLSNRYHLLMVAKMYHSAFKKEEESDSLTHELDIAGNSVNTTQISLQESKLQTYQLQKELILSHLSRCMEGNISSIMAKSHVEEGHEKR